MDQKKVIEKLIKIAENQQKIINKLVQAQGALPPDSLPSSKVEFGGGQDPTPPAPPPPGGLKPDQPRHMHPVAALKAKMQADSSLTGSNLQINDDPRARMLTVTFPPKTIDKYWNSVQTAFNAAINDKTLQSDYKWQGKELPA